MAATLRTRTLHREPSSASGRHFQRQITAIAEAVSHQAIYEDGRFARAGGLMLKRDSHWGYCAENIGRQAASLMNQQ
jgi:hypothetical protein